MQILKESVLDKIILSAKRLFAKRGFKETSMRMIAKEAGITAGNIYRYFDTKEEILESIMEPLIAYIQQLICDHEKDENLNSPEAHRIYHEFVASSMVDIYQHYRQEYTILLRKAAGTAYENYYDTLVTQIGKKIRLFCAATRANAKIHSPEIYDILARSHVDAIIYTLEHVEDFARKEAMIKEYLDLQFSLIFTPEKTGDSQ